MNPHITLICALAANRAIGHRGRLLYHISADLRRFKALTTGHTVLMGRRTFETLPKGALPNRRNIVLTRQQGLQLPGTEVFASLAEALSACQPAEQVFVIGGESVYAEAFPLASRLCLTHIHAEPAEADAYFPQVDLSAWRVEHEEHHEPDTPDGPAYTFTDYTLE